MKELTPQRETHKLIHKFSILTQIINFNQKNISCVRITYENSLHSQESCSLRTSKPTDNSNMQIAIWHMWSDWILYLLSISIWHPPIQWNTSALLRMVRCGGKSIQLVAISKWRFRIITTRRTRDSNLNTSSEKDDDDRFFLAKFSRKTYLGAEKKMISCE